MIAACRRLRPSASATCAVRAEVGPAVTVVAATKYVSLEDMAVLVEAGIEVVGENRAQDLEAKHAEYGDAFRWHFIGHLQSNKADVVNGICELVHSLDSESAARRLTVPALVEVNLSGEPTKSGVEPEELEAFLRLAGDVRGLMTMPPATADPEASRPYFRRLRELAERHGLARALDGHVAGLPRSPPRRARPWSASGLSCCRSVAICRRWDSETSGTARSSTSASPRRTRTGTRTATPPGGARAQLQRAAERAPARAAPPRARVRRLDRPRGEEPPPHGAGARGRAGRRSARGGADPGASVRVHLVMPRSFNDAQQIADKFKDAVPVILNLQGSDAELSKRLIDFASGLTYALDGGMQRVADKVFLLTPRNVEVSAEERAQLLERGGFFNQA